MKKIVIQVHMEREKCRSKAMKIAAASQGVNSVSLEGESRNQVVVTGNGIDSVCLTNKLRKKFHHATLISVEDVIVNPTPNEAENNNSGRGEQNSEMENVLVPYCNNHWNYPPHYAMYHVVYDPYPNYYGCFIL
ncbi:hypothetical protein TanjilG_18936 [Lupinus angustifolius]|uniref:HMA domain-containing protein n=1 Tax=Lupinus angustifolius TaxID=3871 RepID=A0A4P1RQN7_LUPAN|nr:PREDICTED: heavy metal-associated isoprenylated plant protein 47-like [Lupinus angustifolius]OIW16221.1 hypothetical protein TanjilG_18936 [Lupinus angustifolius]